MSLHVSMLSRTRTLTQLPHLITTFLNDAQEAGGGRLPQRLVLAEFRRRGTLVLQLDRNGVCLSSS